MATAPELYEETGAEDDSAPVDMTLRATAALAQHEDDLTPMLSPDELASIGNDVVEDYERDLGDRSEWETSARDALKRVAQEKPIAKTYPFPRAANVNYPILTVAAQQFWAKAYPALCKSGDMVKVRIIGSDRGRPKLGPDGQPVFQVTAPDGTPVMLTQSQLAKIPPELAQQMPKPEQAWEVPPGSKTKRADRVSEYMNVYLEYRMEGWEGDTSLLLFQLPIIGCGFRKLWWCEGKQKAAYVSALDLVVPNTAKSLLTTPRITEQLNDVYPYQIRQRMASGEYRTVELPQTGEDSESPRLLLEQHRFLDLDEDGVDEPYIITVDKDTREVLRVVANFTPDDVKMDEGRVVRVDRGNFYVKYSFLPHPRGEFYDIGFGHLLDADRGGIGDIVNTTINQMFDAGHAQIAGGGFIASGLRLQGNNRTNRVTWSPGEYKTVNASGNDIRAGIVERTFPNASPIMFQLLELMLGAAKDITSVKDVVTGEAPNNAPVGTTLALIEQGMSFFTAIYKLIYLGFGEEYQLVYKNLGTYGEEETAKDYATVLDDPQADFAKDFQEKDMDIKPVADPTSVTRMQQIAKAQILFGMKGQGLNDMEINRRVLEAANIEDIDSLMPPQDAPPPPQAVAELEKLASETRRNNEQANWFRSQAVTKVADTAQKMGEAHGYGGGLPGMEGAPGDGMGPEGAGDPGGGPEQAMA